MSGGVDRLCFGTSTFVAGRLRPDKSSTPGIAALTEALRAGVRLIHTNPKLGTQWAVGQALDAAGDPAVRHLIKIELPVEVTGSRAAELVDAAVLASAATLGVTRFHAAVIELDLKRWADPRTLVNPAAVASFYATAARAVLAAGRFDAVYGYCHSAQHLAACLRIEEITGYAAQLNPVEAWPVLYLDRVRAAGRPFVAMAPLRRGLLAQIRPADPARPRPSGSPPRPNRLRALRWVLAHPGVTATAITISSVEHLHEVIEAAADPAEEDEVRSDLAAWCAAFTPDESTGPHPEATTTMSASAISVPGGTK